VKRALLIDQRASPLTASGQILHSIALYVGQVAN